MSPRQQNPLTLEYTLIGLLARQPCHGYELYKEISRADGLNMIWHIKQSLLYALLDKLEKDGLIEADHETVEQRPARIVYHVTHLGQARLSEWMAMPSTHPRDIRQQFLARLYLAELDSPQAVQSLVSRQVAECQNWLLTLEQRMAAPENSGDFALRVLRYRYHHTRAILSWLQEFQQG